MMNTIFTKDVYTGTVQPLEENARAAIYCRLSKDDENEGDSSSIQTQKAMLENYCTAQGFKIVAIYQDDGFTGLNMTRPEAYAQSD